MKNKDINKVSKILEEVGEMVRKDPEGNTLKLREGVKEIEIILQNAKNRHLMFLSYFLGFFIEDVWSNIAMDSSFKIDDKDVTDILYSIGTVFINIGKHLEQERYYECYDNYVSLFYDYLSFIESIKEKIGE